jgi:hypothetical protein
MAYANNSHPTGKQTSGHPGALFLPKNFVRIMKTVSDPVWTVVGLHFTIACGANHNYVESDQEVNLNSPHRRRPFQIDSNGLVRV